MLRTHARRALVLLVAVTVGCTGKVTGGSGSQKDHVHDDADGANAHIWHPDSGDDGDGTGHDHEGDDDAYDGSGHDHGDEFGCGGPPSYEDEGIGGYDGGADEGGGEGGDEAGEAGDGGAGGTGGT